MTEGRTYEVVRLDYDDVSVVENVTGLDLDVESKVVIFYGGEDADLPLAAFTNWASLHLIDDETVEDAPADSEDEPTYAVGTPLTVWEFSRAPAGTYAVGLDRYHGVKVGWRVREAGTAEPVHVLGKTTVSGLGFDKRDYLLSNVVSFTVRDILNPLG